MSIFAAIPIYFLLLMFPESPKHCALANNDSSFQVLFASYVCIAIAAVAQATFLPTIVHTSMHFSTQKPKLYTAIVNLVVVPLYWTYLLHSGWTRERMWHSIVTFAFSIHCYQYRPTAALTPTDTYNIYPNRDAPYDLAEFSDTAAGGQAVPLQKLDDLERGRLEVVDVQTKNDVV
ncbi:hypothetical protein EYZ11_003885 [Aspergillus tanneri]|uniref:Uncharacterized protein n=1 Tax=Aspergillus tanneri TaxID=1220188 RepID=A0A4S3JMC1_9EURO|nr:hypothetical protein EYZ11_003885 [Aspergillus tanneri]